MERVASAHCFSAPQLLTHSTPLLLDASTSLHLYSSRHCSSLPPLLRLRAAPPPFACALLLLVRAAPRCCSALLLRAAALLLLLCCCCSAAAALLLHASLHAPRVLSRSFLLHPLQVVFVSCPHFLPLSQSPSLTESLPPSSACYCLRSAAQMRCNRRRP